MAETPEILSPDDLLKLEAKYQGIPDLSQWLGLRVRPGFDQYLNDLRAAAEAANDEDLAAARLMALRSAAFDTGAIEDLYVTDRGLTQTVAIANSGWEEEVKKQDGGDGDLTIRLFEAQLKAYELAQGVVDEEHPVSEKWIRELHEIVTKPQPTYDVKTNQGPQQRALEGGKYKDSFNYVRMRDGTLHPYSPVDRLPDEMNRLVQQLRSSEFASLHPVIQAALAHYGIAAIHPFPDGNGRVARLVGSVFLLRAFSVPLMIYADERSDYLDALEAADAGSLQETVTFFEKVSREGILDVRSTLLGTGEHDPAQLAEKLREALEVHKGRTHREMDDIAAQAFGRVFATFQQRVLDRDQELPVGISVGLTKSNVDGGPPEGYRQRIQGNSARLQVNASAAQPFQAGVSRGIACYVADDEDQPFDVVLAEDGGSELEGLTADMLESWDVHGERRFQRMADRIIDDVLATLLERVKSQRTQ